MFLHRLRVVLFGVLDQPTEIVKDVLACGHPGSVELVVRKDANVVLGESNTKQKLFHHSGIVHTTYKSMKLEKTFKSHELTAQLASTMILCHLTVQRIGHASVIDTNEQRSAFSGAIGECDFNAIGVIGLFTLDTYVFDSSCNLESFNLMLHRQWGMRFVHTGIGLCLDLSLNVDRSMSSGRRWQGLEVGRRITRRVQRELNDTCPTTNKEDINHENVHKGTAAN